MRMECIGDLTFRKSWSSWELMKENVRVMGNLEEGEGTGATATKEAGPGAAGETQAEKSSGGTGRALGSRTAMEEELLSAVETQSW